MTTEATWTKRVEAWHASGLSATEFSDGRGFAPATLRWWSSRLGRARSGRAPIALARVVTRPSREGGGAGTIVVEVADALLRVPSGVAREDLMTVLDALEARARGGTR
jgi:hypothetical protein